MCVGVSAPGSRPVSVSKALLSFILGCNTREPETHGDFSLACLGLALFLDLVGRTLGP